MKKQLLTKPISLYPDAVSISPTDNKITLSATYPASCSFETFVGEDGVEYCYASLLMSDGETDYKVVGDNFYPTVIRGKTSITVEYLIDLSRSDLKLESLRRYFGETEYYNGGSGSRYMEYYITSKNRYISYLKRNKIYRWKIRVFEKGSIVSADSYFSNTIIGYGSISNCTTSQYVKTQKMLTIFPHTNIYMQVAADDFSLTNIAAETSGNTSDQEVKRELVDSTRVPLNTIFQCVARIDENIRYYILIDGVQYSINKYSFIQLVDIKAEGFIDNYKHAWYNNDQNASYIQSAAKNNFDSYGNPLSGYILLDTADIFEKDFMYKIACNYIDSDEAYFEMHSEPVITLTETNAQIELTDVDGNVLYTKTNPYSLSYCNINILGEIYQAEGVEHSYYSYKIYEKNNIGDYERIYHSSNIYNSNLRIMYEDFLDGREYKIVLTIVYTNNRTFERELYFVTSFTPTINPIMARAEYYKDHNSVIVEWSQLNSITPNVKNKDFEFIDLSGDGENDAVYIDNGNTVTYYQNDFNQSLSFIKPLFGIRFKATENIKKIAEVHSPDNIYTITMDSFYNVDEKDCDDVIIIDTATTRYVYSIKNITTTEEAAEALSSGISPTNKTLVWDNNLTWDETYTWVNGQNTNESEYEVIISSDETSVVRCITTGEILRKIDEFSYPTPIVKESKVILYDNVYFTDMTLVNNSDNYNIDEFVNAEWQWNNDTQLLASFSGSFNAAEGSTIGNSKLLGYKVYKSIGNSVKLHKIAETTSDETIIEDFIVGDNCEYKYYIYPLFQDQLNEKLYYPNEAVVTNEVMLHYTTNKVVSLKKIGDEVYCVDLDGVWRLMLDLEDNGYTIKNQKTFADSLNAYTQEYVGNMKYITKSVSGFIGMIDCFNKGEIVDTYDMLISWNDFVTSADLKCYVDSRGLILPGNFEAEPSIEYVKHPKSYAVAKFNWRQKSDLDIIKIYATVIPYNPIHEGVLYSDDSLSLISVDNKLLLANGR